jgi:LPXTG-site transpeptidase (sortase) family protein
MEFLKRAFRNISVVIALLSFVTVSFLTLVALSVSLDASFDGLASNTWIAQAAPIAYMVSETSALPVRLQIPVIGVDATIEKLGLTADGKIAAPIGPSDAAWFDQSPIPGAPGDAVIDGHYGWKDGISAAFDNLNQIKKGDRIYVEDQNGNTVVFVVSHMQIYDPAENTADIFVSHDGRAHLNLITCEGVWNASQKSYSGRLVVFADKLE